MVVGGAEVAVVEAAKEGVVVSLIEAEGRQWQTR
jgi:hypothetical protein